MERIISSVKLTGQSKGFVADILKTGDRTGAVRDHGKAGVLIASGAEIREKFHAFQRVVGGIVANAAGRHSDGETQVIDTVLDCKTEESRSSRSIDIVKHFVHFLNLGILVVIGTFDIPFKFEHFAIADAGIQYIDSILFGNRPFQFHGFNRCGRLTGCVRILQAVISGKLFILSGAFFEIRKNIFFKRFFFDLARDDVFDSLATDGVFHAKTGTRCRHMDLLGFVRSKRCVGKAV